MKGELEIHRHRFRPKEPTDDEFWVIFLPLEVQLNHPKKWFWKEKLVG